MFQKPLQTSGEIQLRVSSRSRGTLSGKEQTVFAWQKVVFAGMVPARLPKTVSSSK
jgi:hypothetical protein